MVSSLNLYLAEHLIFDYIIFGLSILIACISLIYSYTKKHKKSLPLIIAIIGFLGLIASTFFHGGILSAVLSVFGGGLIAFAHFKNWKFCRR